MSARAVRLTKVDIDNALANAHLETVFQPILSLEDKALLRHEVFVRWDHPGLGNLPPGAFISFFESQGRIGELTRYVLKQALTALTEWTDAGESGVSINLSLSDLQDPTLPDDIADALEAADISPARLTLECPGFEADVPLPEQLALYTRLAATGCPLALEARGRESDFTALDPFPFREIKTGGSHILRYARSSRGGPGLAALSELVAFAKSHDARMVAVGVENDETIASLRAIGFDAGQGLALGRTGPLGSTLTQTAPAEEEEKPAKPAKAPRARRARKKKAPEATPLDLSAEESKLEHAAATKRARIAAAKRAALRRFHAAHEAHRRSQPSDTDPKEAVAERRAAIQAASNARQLQARLEQSFTTEPVPSPDEVLPVELLPEAVALTNRGLGITVTANFTEGLRLDGYAPVSLTDTDDGQHMSIAAGAVAQSQPRGCEIPSEEIGKGGPLASLLAELPADIDYRANVVASPIEQDLTEPEDVLDAVVAQVPLVEAEPVTALVATPMMDGPVMDGPLEEISRRPGTNFLTRKYRITHFWPRSWKRAWHRWQATSEEGIVARAETAKSPLDEEANRPLAIEQSALPAE